MVTGKLKCTENTEYENTCIIQDATTEAAEIQKLQH